LWHIAVIQATQETEAAGLGIRTTNSRPVYKILERPCLKNKIRTNRTRARLNGSNGSVLGSRFILSATKERLERFILYFLSEISRF
jgi:hypothetical protein